MVCTCGGSNAYSDVYLPLEGGYRVLIAASKKSVLLSEPLVSAIFVSV
jgi:hypothetical protein